MLYAKLTKYFQEKGDNYDEMVRKAREAEDARIAEEEAEKRAKRKKATEEQIAHLRQTMQEHEDQKIRGERSRSANCGTKLGHFETSKIHCPTSEGVSE